MAARPTTRWVWAASGRSKAATFMSGKTGPCRRHVRVVRRIGQGLSQPVGGLPGGHRGHLRLPQPSGQPGRRRRRRRAGGRRHRHRHDAGELVPRPQGPRPSHGRPRQHVDGGPVHHRPRRRRRGGQRLHRLLEPRLHRHRYAPGRDRREQRCQRLVPAARRQRRQRGEPEPRQRRQVQLSGLRRVLRVGVVGRGRPVGCRPAVCR